VEEKIDHNRFRDIGFGSSEWNKGKPLSQKIVSLYSWGSPENRPRNQSDRPNLSASVRVCVPRSSLQPRVHPARPGSEPGDPAGSILRRPEKHSPGGQTLTGGDISQW